MSGGKIAAIVFSLIFLGMMIFGFVSDYYKSDEYKESQRIEKYENLYEQGEKALDEDDFETAADCFNSCPMDFKDSYCLGSFCLIVSWLGEDDSKGLSPYKLHQFSNFNEDFYGYYTAVSNEKYKDLIDVFALQFKTQILCNGGENFYFVYTYKGLSVKNMKIGEFERLTDEEISKLSKSGNRLYVDVTKEWLDSIKPTPSPTPVPKVNHHFTKPDKDYDPHDYADPEDLYEDHPDDYYDFDDAEADWED